MPRFPLRVGLFGFGRAGRAVAQELIGDDDTDLVWVARRRDHGGVIFVDLRDASGIVQVVFREGETLTDSAASPARGPGGAERRVGDDPHALRNEFCVQVTGQVERRPEGNENPELPTGEVEVTVTELVILSEAAPLPLPVDDHIDAGDDVRLTYVKDGDHRLSRPQDIALILREIEGLVTVLSRPASRP